MSHSKMQISTQKISDYLSELKRDYLVRKSSEDSSSSNLSLRVAASKIQGIEEMLGYFSSNQ